MTFAAASLYRYTPGASGNCATFSRRRFCEDCISERPSLYGRPQQYTWIMSCGRACSIWVALAVAAIALAQQPPKEPDGPPPAEGADSLPPQEDKPKAGDVYTFNPLRSKKDVTVG